MSEPQWNAEARVERVRLIAARIYGDVIGESTREVMHAMALATAALIKTNFKGLGQARALQSHIDNVRHHTNQ
jgi:hypothetical protein